MTFSNFIIPRARFGRSVHLERDGAAFSFAPDEANDNSPRFFFTPSIREALAAFALGLQTPSERAVTLVGPYGAGKSAFAVFLANLLGASDSSARALLRLHDGDLAARFGDERPFLIVKIVGARVSLASAMLGALQDALEREVPAIHAQIAAPFSETAQSPRAIADAFGEASRLLCQNGWGGILVIIDELGKFLEFAATHPRQSDVFVLQELAEGAARSGEHPLLVLGMLHQNPQSYAQRLSRAQQAEWTKVAQRFRQVTLFPSDIERMDMVGRALQQSDELHLNGAFEPTIEACAPFAPTGLDARFGTLARAAFPLHPLALLALPPLFARAGQSHRSLFNFVCGEERAALAPFLREQPFEADRPTLFTLDRLFDYAREVLGSSWSEGQGRSWMEAVESVERIGAREPAPSPLMLSIVKAIGLLSWLRAERLPASREVLRAAFEGDLEVALGELEAAKLIIWSRARNRYRLWEGGDIDIEAEIALAGRTLSGDVTIRAMTDDNLCPLPRLNARRHSFQTGTIRSISVLTVRPRDAATSAEQMNGELAVLLILAENEAERSEAEALIASWKTPNLLFGLALESETLREAAAHVAACEVVAQSAGELEGDRAARRELGLRRNEAQTLFTAEAGRLFHPILGHLPPEDLAAQTLNWWHMGEPITLDSPRALSAWLSEMADLTFWATPILRNELLNRRALSSAGAGARRALLTAMLERPDQELLGFTGFPPERSMYQCALEATQLHVESEAGWQFQAPPSDHPTRLRPAWDAMAEIIFASPPREVAVEELAELLHRPPFGVSAGAFPVLLAAFMRVHEDEITLYEGGAFKPEIGAADWEMLTRRPDKFAVAGCRVMGARRAVVERLGTSLGETADVVPIVRRILKITRALPEFAWKTRALASEVLNLRVAIERARSPENFLFEEVPVALRLLPLGEIEDEMEVETFFAALNAALSQWNAAMPQAIQNARDQLLRACELPEGETGWHQLREEAARRNGATVHPLLTPFFNRLAEPSDTAALEGTLALIAHRPAKTWTNADVANFPDLVAPIGAALREVRRQHAAESPANGSANQWNRANLALSELSVADQKAVQQLVKRLSKDFLAKDGTPISAQVVRLALEALLSKL